ncbi:MAG: hypothetical protein M3R24_03585 [Chloroflexota bacterium]|nr:hypothetical protein [Chloroflexota bacterium]PLS77707.1 MAG: hypothetical protein CYG59_22475 [Chloroflexota bacterium]
MRQEPILIREKRFNLLPYRFLHRGMEQRVRRVEQAWDVGVGWRQRAGHYFRVRCQDDQLYDLFHDVELNAWFVRYPRLFFGQGLRTAASAKGKLRWTFT